jgi:hypothetical protein
MQHNRHLLSKIGPEYSDWIITITFYTALHVIDALFCFDKVPNPVNHETRNRILENNNRYSKIWYCYRPLYSASRTARYLADPSQWVPFNDIQQKIFEARLYPIENSYLKLTGDTSFNHTPITLSSRASV